MSLKRTVKTLIFTICLGVMITGVSVFAIDGQIEEIESSGLSLLESSENNIKKEIMDQEYEEYYSILKIGTKLDKDIARNKVEIYNDKREIYFIKYNAELDNKTKDELARLRADIYIAERKKGKEIEYADYYSGLIVCGYNEKTARSITKIYIEERKKGKEVEYASYYSRLIVSYRYKKESAKARAELYEEKIKKGRTFVYASYYTTLILDRKINEQVARIQAEVYEKERDKNTSYYSDYYATSIVKDSSDEKATREYAEIYEKEREINNKSHDYAEYYAILIRGDEDNEEPIRYCVDVYMKELESGRSKAYARCYSELIMDKDFFSEKYYREYTEEYAKFVDKGGDVEGADFYANLIVSRKSGKKTAEYGAKLYTDMIREKKEHSYANYYAILRSERKLDDKLARAQADLCLKYERIDNINFLDLVSFSILKLETGLSDEQIRRQVEMYRDKYYNLEVEKCMEYEFCLDYYIKCKLRGLKEPEIKKMMEIYNKELDKKKSVEYAKYYAGAIIFLKLDKNQAMIEAEDFERSASNKSSIYVDYYIYSLIKYNDKELAKLQAEMYERDINLRKSKIVLAEKDVKSSYKVINEDKIYKEKIDKGNSVVYAKYYSKVKVNQNLMKILK